jgi:lysophospholipase L1-like esterase
LSEVRTVVLASLFALACGAKSPAESAASATTPPAPPQHAPAAVPPTPPPAPEPVVTPASQAAHAHAQTRTFGQALPVDPLVHFVPITDAATALSKFHAALRRLADGSDPDGKVRVAIYGSSSVAVDRYPGYLRGYLQQRFGDGGIGFVAAAPLWRWHRHNEVVLQATKGWTIEHVQKKNLREGGHLGLIGAAQSASRKRVTTTIAGGAPESFSRYGDTDRVELHYLAHPKGGKFVLELGDRKLGTLSTRASVAKPVVHTPKLPAGDAPLPPLRVRVVGDGEVRLLGATLERDTPGVVVDTLGIGGTRAANMLAWDEPSWTEALAARAPDLIVLAYGANECMDLDEPIDTYRANLVRVLERFAAAAPQASCVLIGPVDFPEKDETGAWIPRPRLDEIIAVQREIAKSRGCGFFDTRALMGGVGSMDTWVVAQLAKADHLHMTKLGYLHFGRVLVDALMRDYDGSGDPAAAPPPTSNDPATGSRPAVP